MKSLEQYITQLIKKSKKESKDQLKWLKTQADINNLLALVSLNMYAKGSWKMQTLKKKSWT